jgi:nucleotide-binding universal stress UspA family protein
MGLTVVLCTDGSELATGALRAGLAVAAEADRTFVITVVDPVDPALAIGGGHAGPVLSASEAQSLEDERERGARQMLAETIEALGLTGRAEAAMVYGAPGSAICDYAAALPASVVVLGTRGHGGLRRAVLGSVSDHVVRNCPCPVITVSMD